VDLPGHEAGNGCTGKTLTSRLPPPAPEITSVGEMRGAKGWESGAASALFNMMRNIDGSIGLAGLSTLLSVRERFHSSESENR
jgi:hypothetical protein